MNTIKKLVAGFSVFFKNQGFLGKFILLALMFFSLMFICSTASNVLVGSNPATATPKAVVEAVSVTKTAFVPSSTVVPTSTVAPSSTPTSKPTSTIMPSFTPKPTATDSPTETPDASLGYRLVILGKIDKCVDNIKDFQTYNTMASTNPYIILDSEWIQNMGTALGLMNVYCGTLGDNTPVPAGFEETNRYLKLYSQEIKSFTKMYAQGIDNMDGAKITASASHMTKATEYLDKAKEASPVRFDQ